MADNQNDDIDRKSTAEERLSSIENKKEELLKAEAERQAAIAERAALLEKQQEERAAALAEKEKAEEEKPGEIKSIQDLITDANESYKRALTFQKEGKWAEYGKELDNLEKVLKELSEISK